MSTDKLSALSSRPLYVFDGHYDFYCHNQAELYMNSQDARIAELEKEIDESLDYRQNEQQRWDDAADAQEVEQELKNKRITELEREIREARRIIETSCKRFVDDGIPGATGKTYHEMKLEWLERNAERKNGQ